MTVSRCVSAVGDARSAVSTPDSDSKVASSQTLSDFASESEGEREEEEEVEEEQSDTESEQRSTTYVHDDDDEEEDDKEEDDIKGRFSRSKRERRFSSGIRELSEDDKKAVWIAGGLRPNIVKSKRCASSLSVVSRHPVFPRSQSAQGVRRPPHVVEPPPSVDKRASLSSFKRSLRLLGFDPGDFGIATPAQEDGDVRPGSRATKARATATLTTRVLRRSVSLDNLRTICQDHDVVKAKESLEKLDRETLSTAVYEEWYFQKLQEARVRRNLEELEKRRKQEDLEIAKAEKQRKSDEKFAKWLEELNAKKRKGAEKKAGSSRSHGRPLMGEPASKEKIEKAFQEWKIEKEKKQRLINKAKNAELQAKMDKEKALKEKKADAIKVFEIWKKRSDELLKRHGLNKDTKKNDELTRGTKRVKKERTGPTFEVWKAQKDMEKKEKTKSAMLVKQEEDDSKKSRQSDRVYEAEQAFEEWLDGVEERLRQAQEATKRQRSVSLEAALPPPWSPGGLH